MDLIKTNKISLLSTEMFDDLLTLAIDKVPLKDFSPEDAIDLWWKDKLRRPNQRPRRPYKKQARPLKQQQLLKI